MTRDTTIYVSERIEPTESLKRAANASMGSIVIVRPAAPTQRLLVKDALTHLGALRRGDDRFDLAVLACDERSDWAAMHTRALIARSLLQLIAPGGRFLLEAPRGFAHRPVLLALLEALAQLAPRGDVSYGVEFEASVLVPGVPFCEGQRRISPAADAN
jgi:hypothetical protein